ncbi:MAG: DUF4388 domain-containing protein [Candidatus Zixiibacteriota bacterium]
MDLDLKGNIERFTLPEIFQLLAAGRKSGTLGIQRDDSIVMVYFKNGEIVYGYGPRQTFHLGQLLKQRGAITPSQLEQAVKIQAQSENSKRLGEIMISRRFIDRADLERVITSQVEELLYSLMSWNSGQFKFYEEQFPTEEEVTVRLSAENVILEGVRRIDEAKMIRETLPDVTTVFTISAAQCNRRDVDLSGAEWNVMALVDGHRSVEEVCRASSLEREETLRLMAQLKLAGLITPTEARASGTSSDLEGMINRLAGLFEDYLTAKSDGTTGAAAPNVRWKQESSIGSDRHT